MKIRAILKIKGDVQEAGYRAFIMKTAQKLKLVGYVENLTDGDVRIVCEGERKAIDEFSNKIRLKNDIVYVESIRRRFSKPKREFKRFEVKTGDLAYEMFQGYVTAGKHFNQLGQKIDGVGQKVDIVGEKVDGVGQKVGIVGEKVDGVGQKVDGVGQKVEEVGQKVDTVGQKVEGVGQKVDIVGQKVDNLTVHTDEHFNKLDEKYGIVSDTLISMNKEQTKTREELTRTVDTLNTLVSSVNILIKEHIEKER